MVSKIEKIIKNKFNIILIFLLILVVLGGVLGFKKLISSSSPQNQALEEVELAFDPEGPYALLYPRRDGNALVLNLKRTASYEKITYELVYVSQSETKQSGDEGEGYSGGIDRAAMGAINTNEKKGEYEQEILFGSCSTGGKCVFDKGVENGTLTLKIQKDNKIYKLSTEWHLQKPDIALGVLTSGDNHFTYKINPKSTDLSLLQHTIINSLSGAPKLPVGKNILGKVYAVNTPIAKELPEGTITIEVAEETPLGSKIAHYSDKEGKWVDLDTKIDGNKLEAQSSSGGIFTILY